LSQRICIAILAVSVMVLPSRITRGQEVADATPSLEEVVVTGSRIARAVDEATGPVTLVTSPDLNRTPADSIGKILQTLPLQTGATHNTQVDNGGDGATRINLHGLGDERTLVLLNGRRFVFGGFGADSSVDLNVIPLTMIERVEISSSGASAIYGADAVAGVVNIITRRDFAGIEVGSQYSLSAAGGWRDCNCTCSCGTWQRSRQHCHRRRNREPGWRNHGQT